MSAFVPEQNEGANVSMNKGNAAQYLPLVQALAEGKTIQLKYINGGWKDIDTPEFNTAPEYYRVKPGPEKLYGVFRSSGVFIASRATRAEAEESAATNSALYPHYAPYYVKEFVAVEEEKSNGNC